MSQTFIFLNGDFEKPTRDWPDRPEPGDLIIIADGGERHAVALGWPVHWLVGDFDSLEPGRLERYQLSGVDIERYPAEKDEIDFELALDLARRLGRRSVEVLGALGGRWDMSLANLFLPRAYGWGDLSVRFRHGPWNILTVTGPTDLTLSGRPGDALSLLPLGQDVIQMILRGCRYPLAGETLRAGFTRGLSNLFEQNEVSLSFASGTLLIIHCDREAGG